MLLVNIQNKLKIQNILFTLYSFSTTSLAFLEKQTINKGKFL